MSTNPDVIVGLVRNVAQLEDAITALATRLAQLESRPSPTPSTGLSADKGKAPAKPSRRERRAARAALRRAGTPGPTPAAPSAPRIAATTTTPLPRAVLEKISVSMSISDAVAGHVVGRAGTGLRQIHDISHAKVSVSQTLGPSATRAVTIRGTSREVGDAIAAIGRRIARRRIRIPRQKKKGKAAAAPSGTSGPKPSRPKPPPASTPSTPFGVRPLPSSQVPPPSIPRAPTVLVAPPAPVQAPATPVPLQTPTPQASGSTHHMSVDTTPGPPSSVPAGSPMQLDAARLAPPSSSSSVQTARRGHGHSSASGSSRRRE